MSQYIVMAHEFDNSPLQSAPLRMTHDEARAVVALWQSEQMDSPASARPTPADVAEGLGIGTDDAVRLLAQVRAEREATRQAQIAAQQDELARAERDARLAELRARQAEARARVARAEREARAQVSSSIKQEPIIQPNKRDATYRVLLEQDSAYWQPKGKTHWVLPALILALLLLGLMAAALWHPLTGYWGNKPDATCYTDGRSVPCSQYPNASK